VSSPRAAGPRPKQGPATIQDVARRAGVSTVTQPAYELGSTAALRLIQRLHHRGPLARQEIVLAHQLCMRDSSRRRERPVVALTS
jgi:DNA-binding LacI/PurR family transcriptional regulator